MQGEEPRELLDISQKIVIELGDVNLDFLHQLLYPLAEGIVHSN